MKGTVEKGREEEMVEIVEGEGRGLVKLATQCGSTEGFELFLRVNWSKEGKKRVMMEAVSLCTL